MMVDGYPSVRRLYVLHLKSYGLTVDDIATFADALVQLTTDSRFDAIFANVNFFDQEGLRFIETVAKGYPGIPLIVILQTALAQNTVARVRRMGASACLIAPTLRQDFLPVLTQLNLITPQAGNVEVAP